MGKIVFENSKRLKLVGVLDTPKNKKSNAIIISHGFMANKDRSRFINLAKSLSKIGFAVLRFDFSGCGESDKAPITIKNQVDDLRSAIKYLRAKGFKSIILVGHSLGGLVSLLNYDKKIRTIVLLAPVTKTMTPYIFRQTKYLQLLKKQGFVILRQDEKEFKIPREYLVERQSINQKRILSKIKCLVLIIHGTRDDHIPLSHSKEALKYLPEKSKLQIIENGDHKLDRDFDDVTKTSLSWISKFA